MNVFGIGQTSQQSDVNPNGFTQEDFLKIFAAQLRHQNPMNPDQQDSNGMIAQVTSFSMLEQLANLSSKMESMLEMTLAGTMTSFVGKEVHYQNGEGQVIQGRVDSVSFWGSETTLKVNGVNIKPGQVVSIVNKGDE